MPGPEIPGGRSGDGRRPVHFPQPPAPVGRKFFHFRGYQGREIGQQKGQKDEGRHHQFPHPGRGQPFVVQGHQHVPVQDDMGRKQGQKQNGQDQMHAAPVMAVPTQPGQGDPAAVFLPGHPAGNQDIFHQQAQAHQGHETKKHQGVNEQNQASPFHGSFFCGLGPFLRSKGLTEGNRQSGPSLPNTFSGISGLICLNPAGKQIRRPS